MKHLKVKVIDMNTIALIESGCEGDLIDLKSIEIIDLSSIENVIKSARDEVYKKYLEKELTEHDLKQQLLISKIKNEQLEEIKRTNEEYTLSLSSKEQEIIKIKNELLAFKEQQSLLFDIKQREIQENYEKKLRQNEKEFEQLRLQLVEQTVQYKELIWKKDDELKNSIFELQKKIEIQQAQRDLAIVELTNDFQGQLNQKENELEQLKIRRSNLQVKLIGEDLERWCNNEYLQYSISGFAECKWYKDNKIIKNTFDVKGTKADYIFEVFLNSDKKAEDLLLSVCCEMKSEAPNSQKKGKNSDFYKKLDEDRVKKQCQYALLVTELEWDAINDTPIRKIAEYPNMYQVRPAYFISFLSLLHSLAMKFSSIIANEKINNIEFHTTQEILTDFENFKLTYLDKPLEGLVNEIENIKKEAIKAHDATFKIINYADMIISTKINEIRNKIDRFDIKKITEKIKKMKREE